MKQEQDEQETSRTILNQIQAVIVYTIDGAKIHPLEYMGAEDFVYDKNGLMFMVRGSMDFNKVIIKLNGRDLYDVELWDIVHTRYDIESNMIDEYNDVEASELGHLLIREGFGHHCRETQKG
jgi:hypothetical protein